MPAEEFLANSQYFRETATPMSRIDFEHTLNAEQLAAVTHGEGPQLVLAGAGSGKTRVITYRIGWLVEERAVDPSEITAVTFTNKAAGEMRERVETLLARYPLTAFVGTFHRFCLLLLRRYGERLGLHRDFTILDADDQASLMKKALAAEQLAETSFPPRTVLAAVSAAKSKLLDPDAYERQAVGFFEQRAARAYRRYQGLLRATSAVDFDDMISFAVALLGEPVMAERVRRRCRYLLVDEFQDTNTAQLTLVRLLSGPDGNLTAVGDEDQGIYRWRGAELENILQFERSFPRATVRKLERNYRSTQTILDAAGNVVANNRGRRGKKLWTDAGAGQKVGLYRAGDEQDEARWIVETLSAERARHGYGGMAVLVRTNAQTRAIEEEFLRHEVPYTLVGGVRFYERAEIKDLVAYLRVARNPRDTLSMSRILNNPPRGIGRSTQDLLEQQAAARGVPVWDYLALESLDRFPARAAKALANFRDLLLSLHRDSQELPLPALLDRVLELSKYAEQYRRADAEDSSRLENLEEFLSAAQEFTERQAAGHEGEAGDDVLTAFLDHVSLVTDLDLWQSDRGVSLMTLHSAKGLEFPLVVVAGIEDDLLPHFNSRDSTEGLEEERRLLYVGMTRAREKLLLTCCRRRRIAGRYQSQSESPFLSEIPAELVEATDSPALFQTDRARPVYAFFGRDREGLADLDLEPEREERPWARGERVQHPVLGQGVVMETEGAEDDLKITVYFERAGKRKLIARYAGLRRM
jgi:DNA helicase-2/ATP-dependent DNA helicase PcrA